MRLKKLVLAIAIFAFTGYYASAQCPVNADFNFNRLCNNGLIHFTDSSYLTGVGQIVDWEWNFGDGAPLSGVQNPTHNYVVGATYNVQLVVTDSSGCTDTIVIPVFVNALPNAAFTFGPNNACSGSTVSFNNTSTGTGLTYLWNFGDGNTSTLQNPSHIYTAYGCGTQNFNATLTVTDANGCSSTIMHVVSVLQQPSIFYFEPNGFIFCHTDTSSVSDTMHVFNFSPDAACIASYTIDWGDGSPLSVSPPALFDGTNPLSHIYTTIGYFPVTITAVGTNGCQTVFTETATVESNPVASLIGPPVGSNVGCAPFSVCVVNMSQNISPSTLMTLAWGDGITDTLPIGSVGDTICHNYLVSGCIAGAMTSYTVTLTSQNICDFSQSSWSPVRIYEPPDADFYLVDDSVCVGENVVIINQSEPNYCAANSATWYTWDFGDGTTFGPTLVPAGANPQQTINHIYGDTGVYVITLTANNSSTNGCGATQFQALVWVSQAYAQFLFDTVCMGDPTHFTDSSWGVASTIISWEWHFGDGGTSNAQNPNHIYPTWGDFNAWLAVTSSAGCTDTVWHIIHVDTLPYVEFAWDTVCVGDPTTFTNLSYGRGSPIIGYVWDFGDGNTSTAVNPVHIYGAAGNYSVTLIATDGKGCIDSVTHIVPVSPPPIPDFIADTVCLGNATPFTDQSIAPFGTIVSWDWDFGDGSGSSALQNPAYIFGDTGTYWVTLIVETNIGCIDSITLPVYVAPFPLAEFTFDTVCAGNPTSFLDASLGYGWPIDTWQWNFGDGNTSGLQNPTHIYPAAGQYIVSLIVTNPFGCSDTTTHTITVDSIPEAAFTANNACLNETIFFIDNSVPHGSPIVSWDWDFGDGNGSTLQNPTHDYASTGTYNVTLVVTSASGCIDSITNPVTVYPLPTAGFIVLSACNGDPVMFTDTSHANGGVIVSWDWNFGDGSGTSNLQNPQYFYGDTGTYLVTLIVVNSNGCTDTVMNPVNYLPRPTADFLHDTSCAGQPIHFTDISDPNGSIITGWDWDFGDGNTSILQNPVHPYATSGSFIVTLIVINNAGCSDTIQHTVVADSLPEPLFTALPVCFGDTTTFTDNSVPHGSAINSWDWDFGDGNTSTLQSPTHFYGAPGVYPVTLIVENANGCSDTIIQNVTVYALPTAAFNYTGTCLNRDIFFTDISVSGSGTINNWDWDFGDGSGTSTNQNPIYQYSVVDSFLVTLIVIDQYGCTDTISDSIRVSPLPVSGFMADSVCLGLPTHFADTSQNFGFAINFWEYDFGDGNSSNLQNPDHIYGSSGNFNVQLVVGNTSNCFDTVQQIVFVKPTPVAQYSFANVCFADTMAFNDNSVPNGAPMLSYDWDFGDGNGSTANDTLHYYGGAGTYPVELIVVNSWNCADTITQNVTVYALPEAGFTASVACIGFATSFVDTSNAGSGTINGWDWDFGEIGGTSIVQDPTYTYTSGGTNYTVSLIVSDQYGCTDTATNNITLHPQPVVDFSATIACSGLPNSFTDLSVPAAGFMASWDWDFGDGTGSSAVQNPNYTYAGTAVVQTYTVTLIGYDDNGCPDTASHVVTVNPNPNASFSFANICFADTMAFNDNSVPNGAPMLSYDWDFGDGNGSTADDTLHYYAGPGNYPVELIVENTYHCFDTLSQNVIVYALPNAGFTSSVACIGFATSFVDTSNAGSGTINGWDWDFGEIGGTSIVQDPTYTYTSGGTNYTVSLIVSDQYGCTDTATNNITLHPQPFVDFSATAACSELPNIFTDLSVPAAGFMASWDWDFGDGTGSSAVQNPNYTYAGTAVVQTYTVTLIGYDDNGCPDTASHVVTVNPNPIADFTSDSACVGNPTTFADSSTPLAGALSSWDWDFGDGSGTSAAQNPTYIYPASPNIEIYNSILMVEDANGCRDTTTHAIRVNPLPVVWFGSNTACTGSNTLFTDSTYSNGGALSSWTWDFGDGTGSSAAQNPAYTYDTVLNPTVYNVNLLVADINGCVHDTLLPVTVNPLPIASFNSISACSGYPSQFTDASTSTGGNIVAWNWDFGDGSGSSAAQNPAYLYPTTSAVTTYNVVLGVSDQNGCFDTIVLPATIYPSPSAGFISDSVCSGSLLQFTDTSSSVGGALTSWNWDFGDGSGTSAAQNPAYTYPTVLNTTPYPVTLIVENVNGCFDTTVYNALIWPNPVVDFHSDIACFGNLTHLYDDTYSNGAALQSWSWDFGDGSGTSTLQYPTYLYGNWGSFNVDLTVIDDNLCTASATNVVVVDSLPIPDFTFSISCTQGIVQFTNNSQPNGSIITGYLWDFDDLSMSGQVNPAHYFTPTGTYDVTLFVNNNRGCSDSITYPVVIAAGLDWDFTATTECVGEATVFNDFAVNPNVPAVGWFWNFGDGTSSTLEDPTHLYLVSGTYNVLLTVTDAAGCTYSVMHNVVVNPAPTANFASTIVTQGNPTTFTDLSTTILGFISAWQWDFGDGVGTSNQQNPLYTYAAPGTYHVTLIAFNSFGCSDTITLPANVLPLVDAEFTFDTVCAQTPTTFLEFCVTGAGTIDYWYWDFGDGYSSNLQNPQHTYVNSGVFTVTLIATNTAGISDSVSHQVLVLEAPNAQFLSTSVCEGNATAFMNQSTGTLSNVIGWSWDLGDGDNEYIPSFSHIYDSAGTYYATLVVVNTLGCTDTISQPVHVWALPQVDISAIPQEGCLPLDVVFTDLTTVADGTITSWMWQFGDGFTSVAAGGAFHQYTAPGLYDITLTVTSNHGCTTTQTFMNYIQVWPNPIASFFYSPTNPSLSNPGVNFHDISVGASNWYWDFGDLEYSTEENPMHTYGAHGDYEIFLVAGNAFGCYDTTSLPIHVSADELLYIPNAITPNGDGKNDWFMPFGAGWSIDNYEMRIYNRWGQLLFVTTDINKPWHGETLNTGEKVPTGVYVWKVWYVDLDGKLQKMIGRVTVYY